MSSSFGDLDTNSILEQGRNIERLNTVVIGLKEQRERTDVLIRSIASAEVGLSKDVANIKVGLGEELANIKILMIKTSARTIYLGLGLALSIIGIIVRMILQIILTPA